MSWGKDDGAERVQLAQSIPLPLTSSRCESRWILRLLQCRLWWHHLAQSHQDELPWSLSRMRHPFWLSKVTKVTRKITMKLLTTLLGSRAGLLCIWIFGSHSLHKHIEKLKFRSTTMARKGTDDKAKPMSGNRRRFFWKNFFSVCTYEVKPFIISVMIWFCRTSHSCYQV